MRERQARRLLLDWPGEADRGVLLEVLGATLTRWHGGDCAVVVRYCAADSSALLTLGEEWKVRASSELIEQLERHFGVVRVAYGPPGGLVATSA